jgi:hypothetical protein
MAMRLRLRTLLVVLAVGPIVLAGACFAWQQLAEMYSPLSHYGGGATDVELPLLIDDQKASRLP